MGDDRRRLFMGLLAWSLGTLPVASRGDWIDLFNGRDLQGWVQRNGLARFEVSEGELIGHAVPNSPNSFLCTTAAFTDFELELEFKIDPGLNSGVQIRSHSLPDNPTGRVRGYQVEIDSSDRGWTGGIYDEARSGWVRNLANNPEARTALRLGEWNRLRIRACGNRIQTWVNGIPAVDLMAPQVETGFIGLQVHSVGDDPHPYQVRWRKIRLRKLHSSAHDEKQG